MAYICSTPCPQCGNENATKSDTGHTTCTKCGLGLETRVVDEGYEDIRLDETSVFQGGYDLTEDLGPEGLPTNCTDEF